MKRILGIALLLSIVYLLAFATPLHLEPIFKPVWSQDLAKPIQHSATESPERVGFRVGSIFGYVTLDGVVKYLNTVQFGLALDGRRFINFSSVSRNLVVKDSNGRITESFADRGYPMFLAGRLLVVSTSRSALSERGLQGNLLWSREFGSIITCLSGTKDRLAVGLLNGTVEVLDSAGKLTWSQNPGGSRTAVIYGCSLSPNDRYLAIASGLDPQRVSILVRSENGYRLVRDQILVNESRRRIFMHFFTGIPYLFVERSGSILYIPTGSGRSGSVPLDGERITGMQPRADGTVVVTSVGATGPEAHLRLLRPPDRIVGTLGFHANELSVSTLGSSMVVGVDQQLLRIDAVNQ